MRVRNTGRNDEKVDVPMTAMIDVVFMLLIYFIMTFKDPIKPEGNFDIYMPQTTQSSEPPDPSLLMATVKMRSDSAGALTYLGYGEQKLWSGRATTIAEVEREKGYTRLFDKVVSEVHPPTIGTGTGDDVEIILDCDAPLAYQFVIEAMTRVCGRWQPDENGKLVVQRLAKKVQFKK